MPASMSINLQNCATHTPLCSGPLILKFHRCSPSIRKSLVRQTRYTQLHGHLLSWTMARSILAASLQKRISLHSFFATMLIAYVLCLVVRERVKQHGLQRPCRNCLTTTFPNWHCAHLRARLHNACVKCSTSGYVTLGQAKDCCKRFIMRRPRQHTNY